MGAVLPETNILSNYLSQLLHCNGGPVEIISRNDFLEASTFPVEIIKCKTPDGKIYNLFCKYLAGMGPNNYGHRGGVEYEAKIYENVLKQAPVSKINYYGQCRIDSNGEILMVMDYLGETLRMLYSGQDDALVKAARWIGSFHKACEGIRPGFVTVYDSNYYRIWSDRFRNRNEQHFGKLPWLKSILDYYEMNVDCFLNTPQTIIHGEYYPRNILLKDGIIYVVDWESAAVACGEIDLASLIEGWDDGDAEKMIATYYDARSLGSNVDSRKRLLMAQIYFHFWWWPEDSDPLAQDDSKEEKQMRRLYDRIRN